MTVAGGKIPEIEIVSHDESQLLRPGGIPSDIEKQDRMWMRFRSHFTSQGIVGIVKDALMSSPKTGKAALDISKIADGTYEVPTTLKA